MDEAMVCCHGDLLQEGLTWQQRWYDYPECDCVVDQLPYEHPPAVDISWITTY